jgi:hypothetical protein
MKKIILLFCAVVIAGSANSQAITSKTSMQEGITKRDNKVWYIKSLVDSMVLDNGVVVYADGTIKTPEHKTYTLSTGDCINFQGVLIGMNQRKNVVDGIIVKNHSMWVWSILNKPILLKNGEYAMPDGTLRLADGKFVQLKNKDFVDFDGNIATASK